VSDTAAVMRCAVHPNRAAHDRCPRCDRPRCDDDVNTYGGRGCAACLAAVATTRPASKFEPAVTAAISIVPVAGIGGWIYSQYVEVHVFSWLVPSLIGVAGSWAATALWQRTAAPSRQAVVFGVLASLLGTALGFRLFPHGPHDPLHPFHEVGLPYLCAVVAAILWPIVLGPSPSRVSARP
jgi:hypothetical protein